MAWWAPLIGPGRGDRYQRWFVVCANFSAAARVQTGPTSVDPYNRSYAMRFPLVVIGDMVNAQRRLVDALGITRLMVIGGSIGGFQVLEWATRQPNLRARHDPGRIHARARSPGYRAQRSRTPGDHGRSRLAGRQLCARGHGSLKRTCRSHV